LGAPEAPYHRSLLVRNAASIAEAAAVSTLSNSQCRRTGVDLDAIPVATIAVIGGKSIL
jgi:hypothetical protein